MLLFADGFDESAIGPGWTLSAFATVTPTSIADRYVDSAGFATRYDEVAGGSATLTRAIAVADQHATNIIGVALTLNTTSSMSTTFHSFLTMKGNTGATLATLWLVGTGGPNNACRIEVRLGATSGGTLLCTTTVAVVDHASWYYIELKYVVGGSGAGSVVVRVNELQVAAASGIATNNGGADTTLSAVVLGLQSNASGYQQVADDFYLCNGAGSVNNDFLGDVRVCRLRPNGAGSLTQWTPAGTSPNPSNFENVNNTGPLVSTVYNAEPTDEEADLYAMSNLPAAATGAVLGVVEVLGVWTSALNLGVAPLVKDSTTVLESAEQALGTTPPTGKYMTSGVITISHDTKPSGGAWTTSEVNAMEVGVRVKSIT